MSLAAKLSKDFSRRSGILVPHLNNWFARGQFPDSIPFEINPNKEKDDAFHPSSAIKCRRVQYASFRKELPPEDIDGTSQKNFMFGHYAHALIQYILVAELGFSTWDDIEREYYFTDSERATAGAAFTTANGNSFDVRGFVDCASCEIPNEGDFVIDVKTVGGHLYRLNELPWSTMEKYEAQVKLYLEFADKDRCILLCAEKDTPHRFKEYIIERDPDLVDQIFDGWEIVADALAAEEPPECTCARPDHCPAKDVYAGTRA